MNNQSISAGVLAPFIRDYINMRKNLGFTSQNPEYSLFSFDAFAKQKGLASVTITKDLAEEWCSRRPDEATDTWSHRNCFLRQLSVYLFNLGYETYIPPKVFARRNNNFIPYIFSDEELEALYKACDSLVLYDKHAKSGMMVLPVLIRMLAATGIRIGEATGLLDKDVNLEENYLILRNCKNGKDRMVPISESLADSCRQYRKYRELLPHNSNFFFIKMNGCKCPGSSFSGWWNRILKMANIKHRGKTVGPRIQDLRHTFCVKSMVRLARERKDLYYILPILSTYVGHQSLAATDRYVRMTSEMYPDLLSQIDGICSYIFSELKYK
jgi:integrase